MKRNAVAAKLITREKSDMVELYRKRARHYDFYVKLFWVLGIRLQAWRKKAVRALNLRRGDTVVEIGCGTGLNFPLLQRAVGPEGNIVGVELADAMLALARERVKKNGWRNVQLVHADAASFKFPKGMNGIISTYAIGLMPEFDRIVRNGSESLLPGKRWTILDFKLPSGRLSRLAPFFLVFGKRFGASMETGQRRTWESLDRYLDKPFLIELYGGFAYLAIGEK